MKRTERKRNKRKQSEAKTKRTWDGRNENETETKRTWNRRNGRNGSVETERGTDGFG